MIPYETEVTVMADIDGDGESCECEARAKVYNLGHPGTMYQRNGDPGDPPEGPEIEILSVACTDDDGRRMIVLLHTIRDEEFEKLQFLIEGAVLEQDYIDKDVPDLWQQA